MTGNIFTELAKGFQRMNAVSELERKSIHRVFAAFYNNDFLQINDILKNKTLNNPFSQATLDKLVFQHINVTKKIINRLTSGIYTNQPLRELIISDDVIDEKLYPLLKQIRYSAKIKDAFRKAVYFNLIVAEPVWDAETNKLRLDIFTPENIEVKTKNDYLQIEKIKVCKARPDGSIYYSVWTEDEHYIIDGEDTIAPTDDNPGGVNPFGKIPFVILRMDEGLDFYGEPNWNLLLNQMNLDIRLTDMDESELRTVMGIWHGNNTNLPDKTRFAAGQLIQTKSIEGEDVTLESIVQDINYTSIRENIDWKNKTVMISEGLSSQSGDVNTQSESGVKRAMDEIELEEKRNEYKETLYNFEIELLDMIRLVNNKYNSVKLNEKAVFEVTFSKEKESESIDDKIKRREMESAIGYYDEVDFTMQDLEVDKQTAIDILKERQMRKSELQLNEVNNPADVNADNNNQGGVNS